MSNMFVSAKSVLSRADHHIKGLKSAIGSFAPDKPYAYRVDHDPVSGKYLHKAIFSQEFSDDNSCIIFDAVNNLRASLDQMTYAIAGRHKPGRNPEDFAPFPFAKDSNHWPNRIRGLKNDIPPEILTIFESFKPFKRGNNTLWALNEMANIKKHAILIPAGFGGTMISVPVTLSEETGFEFAKAPFFAGRYEVELFRTSKADIGSEIGFTYTIVIRHPEEVINGQAPAPLLDGMRVEVAIIFTQVEAACRRLGWA